MTAMALPPFPPAGSGRLPALESVTIQRWRDGRFQACTDLAAAEIPVSLDYNGISHAVMLASPTDIEDFATGFSLTEGIIGHPREILDLETEECCEGLQVRLTITAARFDRLKRHRRSLAGRTGCGLCGAESLSQVFRDVAPVTAPVAMAAEVLNTAFAGLEEVQPLQRLTGATHAAAWVEPDGRLVLIREDVGRHNALDKLIGAMALAGIDTAAGAAMVTSRASYEMVQKAAAAGIGILAAISAPTTLAIRMAGALNLTLVGFARRGQHVLYAGPQRIRSQAVSEGVAP